MTDTTQASNYIHSCGYHCDKPDCVKDQRDELVRKYIAEQEASEFNEMTKRGSKAWKDVHSNFVDDLRGGEE